MSNTTPSTREPIHPYYLLPSPPPVVIDSTLSIPNDRECKEYWAQFDTLPHIAEHSFEVARIATFLAARAKEVGFDVSVPTVRASALLHDIAKSYCIKHGGNHSQLGGAWVTELTGNPAIAVGVTHHVYWPFELDFEKYFTPLAVIYADKRVNHTEIVSIKDRFEDLVVRYNIPADLRYKIKATETQALDLEQLLSDTLEVDLNECDFNSGRLV